MHPVNVEAALKSMVCLVDTKEQDTPRFRARMENIGMPWKRQHLNFADYSIECTLPNGEIFSLCEAVAIERKMDLGEICTNYGKGRKTFIREFERCKKADGKIYILIEDGSWEKAYQGKYRSMMNPASLTSSLQAWMARYNCCVLMCRQETTPKLIHDILYRELKERLEELPDGEI